MGVPIFVRPDCPPEDASSASAAPKKEKRSKGGAQNARPQFRSALEQVWLLIVCPLAAAPSRLVSVCICTGQSSTNMDCSSQVCLMVFYSALPTV